MKKILIVSYYFPPTLSAGVFRPAKIAKYLRESGWTPIVLAARKLPHMPVDSELFSDIPSDIKIYRCFSAHPKYFKHCFKKILQRKRKHRAQIFTTQGSENKTASIRNKLLRNLVTILKEFLLIPDETVFWLPFAFLCSLKIMRRHKIDLILTTSPPESSHILGLLLKKCFKVPWVVDFRDLWTHNMGIWEENPTKIRLRTQKLLEEKVILSCDAIINISHGEKEIMVGTYKNVSCQKFHVITNGYDQDDFHPNYFAERKICKDKLLLVHIGTVYPTTATEYFDVVEDLLETSADVRKIFECRFVGFLFPEYYERVKKSKYKANFVDMDIVPHSEAIRFMCEADVLLILLGGELIDCSEIPGKLFWYLAARKPILVIARDGDVAKIIRASGSGQVFSPYDKEGLRDQIDKWCHTKKDNKEIDFHPNVEYISQFDYKSLAKKFSKVFSDLIKEN